MIEEFTKTDSRLAYVDVDAPMIGDDGKPRADLFVKDGFHLNEAGYRVWTSLIMPYVESDKAGQDGL